MLATTYSSIINTSVVLEEVVESLSLEMAPEHLKNNLSISQVGSNPILKITVNDENAVSARDIADSLVNVFSDRLVEVTKYNCISILEDAKISNMPINQPSIKQAVFIGIIGFMLGISSSILLEYLDRTIKSSDELEKLFDVPVLGVVPERKITK